MSIKSELAKSAEYLRNTRNAILDRGGEISPNAGLKDLPDAISNIPPDIYVALRTDDTTAYKKTVPTNAEKYAYLSSIGGMTFKEADTFVATVTEIGGGGEDMPTYPTKIEFEYIPSIPFMLPSPSEDGLWFFQAHSKYFESSIAFEQAEVYLNDDTSTAYYVNECLPSNVVISKIKGVLLDGTAIIYDIPVGTEFVCTPAFYDWGTTSTPEFNPPARLRDTKVTAVRSYKADGSLMAEYPLPQSLIDAQTGKGVGKFSDMIDLENGKIITQMKTIKLADVTNLYARSYGTNGTNSLDGNKYISNNGMTSAFSYDVNDFVLSPVNQMLCDMLPNTTSWQGTILGVNLQKMTNGAHYININIPYQWVGLEATETSITPKFVGWLKDNDATLTYALAAPTEGELHTDFNPLIEVEAGGQIEFVNEYGIAVPSTIKYITKAGA